ncbi:MAG: transporter substrate-binding domain-containing protein, partial [Methanomassiliicoccales archaeon]|nr:transporter substrate-binding domain-containing protein [Methanomassiliicoccales archaeon]
MSGAAGNPPNPSSPYGKKDNKTMMYALVAIMLVVGLVAGYFIGATLAQPQKENDDLDDILARGQLIVASDTTWPPFEIYNATSQKYEGVDIEVAQRIADELGVELVIKPLGWDAVLAAAQTGQADISISSITITPDRAKSVDFSDPYYSANQAILVKSGSSIDSLGDLDGKKIGCQLDTTGAIWVSENLVANGNISEANLIQYSDIPSAVASLDQGTVDAVICDTPVAVSYSNNEDFDFVTAFTIYTYEDYGIMIAKGNLALKMEINRIIAEMKDDGSL